jgi:hypothetical protein
MSTLFDSLVDVTLGVTAPIAPLTPPIFATPGAQPYELDVVVEGAAPRRAPTTRRAVEAAREAQTAAFAASPLASRPPAPAHADAPAAAPAPPLADRAPPADGDPLVPLRWAYRWSPVAAHAHAPAADRTREAPSLHDPRGPSVAHGGDGGGGDDGPDDGAPETQAAAPRASRTAPPRDARTTPPGRRRDPDGDRAGAGETIVKVTIGRVDVRAVHAREPARAPAAAPAKAGPSLGDYLRDRSPRGGR